MARKASWSLRTKDSPTPISPSVTRWGGEPSRAHLLSILRPIAVNRWLNTPEKDGKHHQPSDVWALMKLQNKVAVITGGNSGIGLAIAREFQENGSKIVIFGRSQETLERAAKSLSGDLLVVKGDVRKLGDLDHLFEQTAKTFGEIDVLVANAGIAKFAPIESMPEHLFDELSDILFKGLFFTVQKALPHMRDGASIILVGSADSDKLGRVGTSIYSAAKAAVRSLARSMSVELLPRRIRVNVVSPGMTDTPIISREGGLPGMTPEQIAAVITSTIPLRRRGTPREMAKAALFLASDDSSYCLGSEILVDGGMTQLVNPS